MTRREPKGRKGTKRGRKNKSKLALSLSQVAAYAEVEYETAARWVRHGGLKASKIRTRGKQKEWRVKKSDLDRYLKE